MAIGAAVFDLGGVLEIVDDDRWQDEWVARWERRSGVASGAMLAAVDESVRVGLERGSLPEAELRAWCRRGLGLSAAEADEMLAEMWDAYCGRLDVPLREFVRELGAGMRVAALSNSTDGARREEQRRYGFEQLFDELIYSHEVGLAKPDPAIYRLTEARLGVEAHEIVFLDDRPVAVQAARACGWFAVLHRETPASIAAIRAIIDANRRRHRRSIHVLEPRHVQLMQSKRRIAHRSQDGLRSRRGGVVEA